MRHLPSAQRGYQRARRQRVVKPEVESLDIEPFDCEGKRFEHWSLCHRRFCSRDEGIRESSYRRSTSTSLASSVSRKRSDRVLKWLDGGRMQGTHRPLRLQLDVPKRGKEKKMETHSNDSSCLCPLRAPKGLSTATVYVKGFGEEKGKFNAWLEQHEKLECSHGWHSDVYGYRWSSGDLKKMALWMGIKAILLLCGRVALRRLVFILSGPAGWWVTAGITLAESLRWLRRRYQKAEEEAKKDAGECGPPDLVTHINDLKSRYDKVRVVAHSLGCRLVLEAVKALPHESRPWRIHLCAPASSEDEVKDILGSGIARDHAWIYYTKKDRALSFRRVAVRGKAMGAVGLVGNYPMLTSRLTRVDVSKKFGFWVHWEYAKKFAQIVEGDIEPHKPRSSGKIPLSDKKDAPAEGASLPLSKELLDEKKRG